MSTNAGKISSSWLPSNGDNSNATGSKHSEKLTSTSVTDVVNPDPNTAIHTILSELECSICLELYLAPQSLACGHVFCGPCLSGWLTSQTQQKQKCPECRKTAFVLSSDPFADTLIPAYKLGVITTVIETFLPKHASEAREERKKEWASIRKALQDSDQNMFSFSPPAVDLSRSADSSLIGVTAPQTAGPPRVAVAPPVNTVFNFGSNSASAESSTRDIRPFVNPAQSVPAVSTASTSSNPATQSVANNTAIRLVTTPPSASSITSTISVSASPTIMTSTTNSSRLFSLAPMSTISASDSPVPTVSTTPVIAASTNSPFGSSVVPTNTNGGFSFTQTPFPNFFVSQQDHNRAQTNTFIAPGNEPANTPAWWRNPARVWSFDPSRGLWV